MRHAAPPHASHRAERYDGQPSVIPFAVACAASGAAFVLAAQYALPVLWHLAERLA